jgi:hypothetical protein
MVDTEVRDKKNKILPCELEIYKRKLKQRAKRMAEAEEARDIEK